MEDHASQLIYLMKLIIGLRIFINGVKLEAWGPDVGRHLLFFPLSSVQAYGQAYYKIKRKARYISKNYCLKKMSALLNANKEMEKKQLMRLGIVSIRQRYNGLHKIMIFFWFVLVHYLRFF